MNLVLEWKLLSELDSRKGCPYDVDGSAVGTGLPDGPRMSIARKKTFVGGGALDAPQIYSALCHTDRLSEAKEWSVSPGT